MPCWPIGTAKAGRRLPETDTRSLLAMTSNDIDATRALAAQVGGMLFVVDRERWQQLPFRALLLVDSHSDERLGDAERCGLYRVRQRTLKDGESPVVGVFPMLAKPGLTPEAADRHWHEVHGPLALVHHAAMTSYRQLAVVEQLAGPPMQGIALCGFARLADLRERFFSFADSRRIIAEDIAQFADTERSPRRLIASVESYL